MGRYRTSHGRIVTRSALHISLYPVKHRIRRRRPAVSGEHFNLRAVRKRARDSSRSLSLLPVHGNQHGSCYFHIDVRIRDDVKTIAAMCACHPLGTGYRGHPMKDSLSMLHALARWHVPLHSRLSLVRQQKQNRLDNVSHTMVFIKYLTSHGPSYRVGPGRINVMHDATHCILPTVRGLNNYA